VYIEQGNFRAAEESLLKVSRPTPEVLYNIAELKLAQGHPEQAAIWYRKAMHLDPSWDKPASRLALVEGSKPAVAAGGGSR
jgi:tetratricopeptide (TPR) repeat protein